MKLKGINGKVWELSYLQEDHYIDTTLKHDITHKDANIKTIVGKPWYNGIIKPREDNSIKSNAYAIFEVGLNSGEPMLKNYTIFLDSFGFFCNVDDKKVYLEDYI